MIINNYSQKMRAFKTTQEVDINTLFINVSDLPRARKPDTDEMITSRSDLTSALKIKWIHSPRRLITELLSQLQEWSDYRDNNRGSYSAALLLSSKWVEKLIDTVNQQILDAWETA